MIIKCPKIPEKSNRFHHILLSCTLHLESLLITLAFFVFKKNKENIIKSKKPVTKLKYAFVPLNGTITRFKIDNISKPKCIEPLRKQGKKWNKGLQLKVNREKLITTDALLQSNMLASSNTNANLGNIEGVDNYGR